MQKILLTVTEAAYLVNYSTTAIYKLINSGKFPFVKKGKNYLIPYNYLASLVERSLHSRKS